MSAENTETQASVKRTPPNLKELRAAHAARVKANFDLKVGASYELHLDYGRDYASAVTGRAPSKGHKPSPKMVKLRVTLTRSEPGRMFGECLRLGYKFPCELRNTSEGVQCVIGELGDFGGLGDNFFVGMVGEVRDAMPLEK